MSSPVIINGTLTIRTIHGRHGAFNVAKLNAPLGQFVIKEPAIDQYDEGSYDGTFVVSHIAPDSYFASGRLVVEVRAYLDDFTIDDVGDYEGDEGLERDPAETGRTSPSQEPDAEPSQEPDAEPSQEPDAEPSQEPDAELTRLFGHLLPLGDIVTLDPTVPREHLRQQTTQLKRLGYRFDARQQQWYLSK